MKKLIKIVKTNLKGTFSWNRYVNEGHHDHKFGPNKTDFIGQMPVIGLLFSSLVYLLIYLLIGLMTPYRLYQSYKEKK
ncbi:hypothetical protein ZZ1p0007 [Acinetobacter phage ZZ1]|nr:hypothetical protein ZZ1p0007 [Acinetobacter phage ZZ1]AHE63472.1 hypothetical protein ZZ1p0007 [Acinetobacter phage ZZ1]